MKTKNLIAMAILAPLLALSLSAKAGTCPTPEEFEKSGGFFTDQTGHFSLAAKPIAFAGAVFMNPSEKIGKIKYGTLNACLYSIQGEEKPKFALLQGAATKVATIAADSKAWPPVSETRTNRYDCLSNNVEACQFNLYQLIN